MDASGVAVTSQPGWLELLFDHAPDSMLVLDEDGLIVRANDSALTLFDCRTELIGRPFELLVPQRLRGPAGKLAALFAAARGVAAGAHANLCGLRADGSETPLRMNVRTVRSNGELHFIVSLIDTADSARLAEVQQQMTALVESAEDAIITKTLDGIVRSWNPAAGRLLGYSAAEIVGQPVTRLIPDDRQAEESIILDKLRQGDRVAHFETVRRRRDGSLVDVSLTISPVRDAAGAIVGASKIMRDISERKKSTALLKELNERLERQVLARTAQLNEREAMLQEIHHRVKNNMQVVCSLINLQMRSIDDAKTKSALQQCQSRIATMSDIHEMLYQSADYGRIAFSKYAKELASRVLSASGTEPASIALRFDLEEVFLPVDKAIPCGLILNELVSNALKHAFPSGACGQIEIALRRMADGKTLLRVNDNGIGIGIGSEAADTRSLGVNLVRTLARQMNATFDLSGESGTTARLVFAGVVES
jgi:PAS domain S-box-containing protein